MIKRETFILWPHSRFKGWLHIDVIPCEFTNLYKKKVKSKFSKDFKFLPHIQSKRKNCISETVFYIVWSSKSVCYI